MTRQWPHGEGVRHKAWTAMRVKAMKENMIIIMKETPHYNTLVNYCVHIETKLSICLTVGDSAALEESEHTPYNINDVPFRVDRHTSRRRLLTPDSGMVNNSGKKIKLDGQLRATKFTGIQLLAITYRKLILKLILEPDPTSKYSNPEWTRPVSPRRRYRQSQVSHSHFVVSVHVYTNYYF